MKQAGKKDSTTNCSEGPISKLVGDQPQETMQRCENVLRFLGTASFSIEHSGGGS